MTNVRSDRIIIQQSEDPGSECRLATIDEVKTFLGANLSEVTPRQSGDCVKEVLQSAYRGKEVLIQTANGVVNLDGNLVTTSHTVTAITRLDGKNFHTGPLF